MRIFIWVICALLLITSGFFFGRSSPPRYITLTETHFFTRDVRVEVPVEVVRTEVKYKPLTEFESIEEVEEFLNGVTLLLPQDAECGDYAKALQAAAETQGKRINFDIETNYTTPDGKYIGGHALNNIIMGDEGWFIEPQTMEIWQVAILAGNVGEVRSFKDITDFKDFIVTLSGTPQEIAREARRLGYNVETELDETTKRLVVKGWIVSQNHITVTMYDGDSFKSYYYYNGKWHGLPYLFGNPEYEPDWGKGGKPKKE